MGTVRAGCGRRRDAKATHPEVEEVLVHPQDSSLYWYTNQNDEKAEGFISLPEFRIDRAIECQEGNNCLEEMNRWMNRLGLAAIGYTPDDKVPRPDEDYWIRSLSANSPVSPHTPTHQLRDSRPDVPGSTHSSGCRPNPPRHPQRRSWQDLIETPLTSSGLHFLQTVPGEGDGGYGSGHMGNGGQRLMSPERRRQATLPAQRRRQPDRDGPFPLVDIEEREQRLHCAHKAAQPEPAPEQGRAGHQGQPVLSRTLRGEECEDDEVPFRKHNSKKHQDSRSKERGHDHEGVDGFQELYRSIERASLSAMGEQRPSTKQEFRRSFVKRCNDPVINDKLHRIRALHSTLKAKEGDLAIISQVLDDSGLSSQKFQQWKQQHHELFVDICEFSSAPTEPHPEGSDLSPCPHH
ncbi:hypothetical protein J4Q44_G00124000 [Coregonus suidteri]|uniref:Uncharacterized protein n=1 Tax=Coregonus suidteri TaxID=861788 RepID=A0AAN8QUE6_9TELE